MYKPLIHLLLPFVIFGCEFRSDGEKESDYIFSIPEGHFEEMERCQNQKPIVPGPGAYDAGPRLHEHGRPAEWKAQRIYLGDTCMTASVGPGVYQDEDNQIPDYYSIDVEIRAIGSEDWLVLFSRDFSIEALPEGFLDKNISEIVRYDSLSRRVEFKIGEDLYEYYLP